MIFVPLSNGALRVDAPEYVIGQDNAIGHIINGKNGGRFTSLFRVGLSEADLKTLFLKVQEYNNFGRDIPVCQNCGGTPAFPKKDFNFPENECVWDIHRSLVENL